MATLQQRFAAFMNPPPVRPFEEQGRSATPVRGGLIQSRERSSKWTGSQRYITITDMVVNTSIIAAGVHHFMNLLAHPRWTVVPADDGPAAREAADFIQEQLADTERTWSSIVRRAATYKFYGFGLQEWTAKKRPDGRIGLRDLSPRPQSSIDRWIVDEATGRVDGVVQRPPQTGEMLSLPRGKLLYLVDDALSDSPEGLGIFRHLAEPWERLQSYLDLEARTFERDLRGIPIGRVPYTLINQAVKNGDMTEAQARDLVRSMEDFVQIAIKQSDTGITLDSLPYDSEAADGRKVSSVQQWGLDLLQGSANGLVEIDRAIVRTQLEMARILTAEHLMLGESSGNRALSEDKSRNLYLVANSVLGELVAAVDRDVISPIWALNSFPDELRPRCQVEDVAFKSAETVAKVLTDMAQAGAVLAPDDPVIDDVRELLGVSVQPAPNPEMLGALPSAAMMTPAGEGEQPQEDAAGVQKAQRTLYVSRKLLNADAIRAWAAEQGIASTLPPDQMHVTVAFSREPVDWSALPPDPGPLVVSSLDGPRAAHQFPARSLPNGALALKFASQALQDRWQAFRDAGASWDFPEYSPHITLTYSVPAADVAAITPYAGVLIFGPEIFAEVDDDWVQGITEVSTRKGGVPRVRRSGV